MSGSQHRRGETARGGNGAGSGAKRLEGSERLPVAQARRLRLRRLAVGDGAPAQPPLEEVDVRAGEAGEGRAEVAVEIAPPATLPGEAEEREQRLAERRLPEAHATLDRVRDAEGAERGLHRSTRALERGHDEGDLLRRGAGRSEVADLLRDELEGSPRACALEEADRTLERDGLRGAVREQVPLQVGERRVAVLTRPGRELLDPAGREVREILLRPPQ